MPIRTLPYKWLYPLIVFIPLFLKAQKTDPQFNDPHIQTRIADSLSQAKQYDQALELYAKAAGNLSDDNQWDLYYEEIRKQILILSEQSDYPKALTLINGSLNKLQRNIGKKDIIYGRMLNQKANIHFSQKKYKKALNYYKQYLEIINQQEILNYTDQIKANQNLAFAYKKTEEYELAQEHFKAMGEGHKKLKNNAGLARTHLLSAKMYYQDVADYDEALKYTLLGLEIEHEDTKVQGRLYKMAGDVYKRKGFLSKALQYKEKVLETYLETNVSARRTAIAYFDIAEIYHYQNDLSHALSYYEESLNRLKNKEGDRSVSYILAVIYRNIGRIKQAQKEYEQAYQNFEHSLDLRQDLDKEKADFAGMYRVIGDNLLLQHKPQEALTYAQKAMQQIVIENDTTGPNLATTYYFYGKVYQALHNFPEAEKHYSEALKHYTKLYGTKNTDVAVVLQNMASMYQAQNQQDTARTYIDQAYQALVLNAKAFEAQQNFRKILNPYKLLSVIDSRADIQSAQYQSSQDVTFLKEAFKSYQSAISLVGYVRQVFQSEGAKEWLGSNTIPLYEKAIQTAHSLFLQTKDPHYKETAFEFSEKSRAALLLEATQENSARQYSGIPQRLLEQEAILKEELAFKEKQLAELEKISEVQDSLSIRNLKNNIFDLQLSYQNLIRTFDQRYHDYYNLKYNTKTISLPELQEKLAPHTTAIEYFLGDSNLYTFVITSEESFVYQHPRPKAFGQWILDTRHSLYEMDLVNEAAEAYKLYTNRARKLYDFLLAPFINETSSYNQSAEGLLIFPAGVMGYIPFETLLKNAPLPELPDYRNLPYLIKDYRIQYGYSATLLYQTPDIRPSKSYIGFAPTFSHLPSDTPLVKDLPPLYHTQKEIEAIAKLTKGQQLLEMQATERQFKELAGKYKVVHLATHGFVDDQHPMLSKIAFTPLTDSLEDNFLHTSELYNMSLNAELVVLSACNTGTGRLVRGEGIISLSRGFIYAGVPSLLMTLWSVNDQSTSQLIQEFFKGLKAGQTKDEALRNARLHYLETADENLAHPYYWAAFVGIGDPKPVNLRTMPNWLLWASILGLVILSLATYKWVRSRPKSNTTSP